jgi:hypothetical protein
VDADTWTLDFMEKHPQLFPWAHLPAVQHRFRRVMSDACSSEEARSLLMDVDASGSGLMPYRRFHVRASLPASPLLAILGLLTGCAARSVSARSL